MTKNDRAAEIAEKLKKNTDAYYERRISYEEFSRMQRATWNLAHRAKVDREVAEIVSKR
jgi:hypothetical protein